MYEENDMLRAVKLRRILKYGDCKRRGMILFQPRWKERQKARGVGVDAGWNGKTIPTHGRLE